MDSEAKRYGPCSAREIRGFSLIELMVTLAVFAIIAAVAYPSYEGYMRKAHRTAAKTALLQIASQEERYYSTNNVYATSLTTLGYTTTTIGGTPVIQVPIGSTHYYNVNLTGTSTTAYQIEAAPIHGTSQAKDSCGKFKLNSLGVKSVASATSTAAECWQ